MLGARSAWSLSLSLCALGASACQAFDANKLDSLLLSPITPVMDAGRDSGTGEPACTMPIAELCNDQDDDCDEKIDEDADEACFLPSTNSVCATGGRCIVVSCDPGWTDCNEQDGDGCEHDDERGPCPGECTMCQDAGPNTDSGPEPEDAQVEDDAALDAEVDAGPQCIAQPETCDGADNDCDDNVDETVECATQRCMATTPSYRGEGCDRCVCEKCGTQLMQCQANPDATWQDLCRDVVECYVMEDRAGRCGGNGDCYANGACRGPIHLAAGGANENDNGPAVAGGCTATTPPTTACQAVSNYRDQCINDLCAAECAD